MKQHEVNPWHIAMLNVMAHCTNEVQVESQPGGASTIRINVEIYQSSVSDEIRGPEPGELV